MARPPLEIDKKQFEKLCALQCTLIEIAGWFGCSDDTIERWVKKEYKKNFAEIFRQKRCSGAVSLRRKQMEIALSGNVAMLIFLGKQYCGQSDKIENKNEEVPTTVDTLLKKVKELKLNKQELIAAVDETKEEKDTND